jgi:hypothetical protein
MVKVTILNQTGHTELELSADEAIQQILDHPTHWAYINGELVSHDEIANMKAEDITDVVLTQAIVGGCY